ncbi:MAG: DUF2029 domain-containing protein [Anaerolineae bacterium]|nr:DUF2029 domain-containing protein [Anaerolineae bacterium]
MLSAPQPASNRPAADFGLILLLFFSSRVMLLLAFPPENLITYGDYQHYFNLAELTQRGLYPFLDYWYEFPPIFPYLNIAVYGLAGGQLKNYIVLLAFVLLVFEAANLYLLYRLALHLYGPARALQTAWIYTALFVPVFFWLGNFDALTTFFILLGLSSLVRRVDPHPQPLSQTGRGESRQRRGEGRLSDISLALALGLGTMVKVVPVLLLATVWRARGFKTMVAVAGATLLVSLLIFGPFFLANPTMTLASLQAQASKSSYETVWALLDGNFTTGNFGGLADHLDPAKATQPLNNPARLPTWLTFIPFGLLGLFIFTRPRRLPSLAQDALVFTALTFVIFFLWSPGWSPQWQTFLIPLLLLALPERRAVLFIVVLGFINFVEWPVILSRGLNQLLPVTILARTLILGLVAFELYQLFSSVSETPKDGPA